MSELDKSMREDPVGEAIENDGVAPELHPASWNEPKPLFSEREQQQFPVDALPDMAREAIVEVQEYMQCPMPLAVAGAFSAMSLAGQGVANVYRDEHLFSPCSLYLLTIAESGERKSAVDDLFARPIRAWEVEQLKSLEPKIEERKAQIESWSAKKEGIESAIKDAAKKHKETDALEAQLAEHMKNRPQPLKCPWLFFDDVTIERISTSFAERWPSAAWMSSEGGAILGGHSFRGDAQIGTFAHLNQRWDGSALRRERQMSQSARCDRPRLTVSIAIQSETLRLFVSSTKGLARETGFFARFLICHPATTQGTRAYREPGQMTKLAAFHKKITSLLGETRLDERGELFLARIELCREGRTRWKKAYDEIERRLVPHGELSDVRDVASKAADNIARLAALFSLLANGADIPFVEPADIDRAARIVEWYLSEAQKVLGTSGIDAELIAASQVEEWLVKYLRSNSNAQLTSREALQRIVPVKYRKLKELEPALRTLQEHDRVKVFKEGRTTRIAAHPEILLGTDAGSSDRKH